jgi:hypothetical protein
MQGDRMDNNIIEKAESLLPESGGPNAGFPAGAKPSST